MPGSISDPKVLCPTWLLHLHRSRWSEPTTAGYSSPVPPLHPNMPLHPPLPHTLSLWLIDLIARPLLCSEGACPGSVLSKYVVMWYCTS